MPTPPWRNRSFLELYGICDGFVQKTALLHLVRIRPEESTAWFLDGLQKEDWMTANLAMDSLVASAHFAPDELLARYHQAGIGEEVQWQIVFVFGHRQEPGSIPLLLEAFREESWLVHTEARPWDCAALTLNW